MGFSLGIIGLPNVGKSTLFNALAGGGAEVANYPFCTIEPNRTVIPVPDDRLPVLENIYKPAKLTHAVLEFIDIAGLVKNAHKGEGLGNKFLSHVRLVDAIAHVVRCFEDENISHVESRINPLGDYDIVKTELLLRDIESIDAQLEKAATKAKSGKKEDLKLVAFLENLSSQLGSGISAADIDMAAATHDELELKKNLFLLTDKPVLVIANVENSSDEFLKQDKVFTELNEFCSKEGLTVVPVAAQLEAEISELPTEERAAFYEEMNISRSALARLIIAGYETLNLITYFTGNKNELAARTLKKGSKAVEAAGKIHTDFARGFIRADVIEAATLIKCASFTLARDKGLIRGEGRDYTICDGDVVQFFFNV